MNKKLLSLYILLCISSSLFSQDFLGLSTGNYAGVTGVLLQPASIVDSRHKFDINIFSTDVRYSNNYFLVDRDAILKFNKNNFGNYQTFKANYLSEANIAAGEKVFFNIANRTQLPSFMATVGKKSAIALSFQSRSMIQGRGITKELAQMAYNGFYFAPLNNTPIDASGLSINSLNWLEAGLTYGRVLYSSDRHFVKGAFTAKYLGGVASLNMGSDDFRFSVNTDSSFNFNSNNFRYNHNKNADFDMVLDKNYRPDDNTFGFDAGIVYEYRGKLKNNKYIKNNDEKSYLADRRDVNKYIFKVGASLLDAGMFTFQKPDNVNSFTANIAGWDIRNGNYNTLKAFDTALANRVTALPNDPRKYNVYLPGALSVQADIRFVKGLFLNVMAYRPLKMGSDAGTRFNNYGYYTITPRYERRNFGVYFPYTFSDQNDITDYKENRLGATVRVGPVFIGSSNLGTMAFTKNLKAADVHVGLKIGITYGKPTKGSRMLKSITGEQTQATTVVASTTADPMVAKSTTTTTTTTTTAATQDKNQLVVDYSKGQVYAAGREPNGQIIIINNNYYYNNNPATKTDSVRMEQMVKIVPVDSIKYYRDSLQSINNIYQRKAEAVSKEQKGKKLPTDSLKYYRDSLKTINDVNQRRADSLNKRTTDSIAKKKVQLDSLINRLQQLRQNMDSLNTVDSTNASKATGQKTTTTEMMVASKQKTVVKDSSTATKLSPATNTTAEGSVAKKQIAPSAATDTTIKVSIAENKMSVNPAADSSINTQIKSKKAEAEETVKKKPTPQIENKVSDTNKTKNQPAAPIETTVTQTATKPAQEDFTRSNELLNRYIAEATQLQADINGLQRRLDAERYNNRNAAAYPTTIVVPAAARSTAPTRVDTVYIRDTGSLRNATVIRDTVTIIKTDTVVTKVTSEPKKIYVPVEKEKIVKEELDYTKIPAETVLFALGSATVRDVYNSKLNYLAGILLKNSNLRISITGHTDKTGSQAVNELLSFKRANTVKHYFMNKGIAANRINIEAVASTEPVYTANSKPDASQNRRVVIMIVE